MKNFKIATEWLARIALLFCAQVSCNHEGNYEEAIRIIETAAKPEPMR